MGQLASALLLLGVTGLTFAPATVEAGFSLGKWFGEVDINRFSPVIAVEGDQGGEEQEEKKEPPVLKSFSFTHLFEKLSPPFDPHTTEYTATCYAGEPVLVLAGTEGVSNFVDHRPIGAESGATDRSMQWFYRPPQMGKTDVIHITTITEDRKLQRVYTINIKVVPSVNPRLHSVTPSVGRVEPHFTPSRYAYYLFVPTESKKVRLDLEAINNEMTKIYVNGEEAGQGTGSMTVYLPKDMEVAHVDVHCVAQDPLYEIRYLFVVAAESGGGTGLRSIDVIGDSTISPQFEPDQYFYKVTLDDDTRYAAFHVTPRNTGAHITVNGQDVCEAPRVSPWLSIPSGESKTFLVHSTAPGNAIPTQYFIEVTRPGSWYTTKEGAQWMARTIGSITFLVNSVSSTACMHATKFLQFLGLTSRLQSGEALEYFHSGFNAWNVQDDIGEGGGGDDAGGVGLQVHGMEDVCKGTEVITSEISMHILHPSHTIDSIRSLKEKGETDLRRLEDQLQPAQYGDGEVDQALESAERGFSAKDFLKKITMVDDNRHNQEVLGSFIGCLIVVLAVFVFGGLIYLIVWFAYLKGKQGVLSLRQDYPVILHPSVFWSFLLDWALIGTALSCCCVFFMDSEAAGTSPLFGVTATAGTLLFICIPLYILYPVLAVSAAAAITGKIQGGIFFSPSINRYAEATIAEVKAHNHCLKFIPIIGRMLTVEVRSIAPVCKPGMDDNDKLITFAAEKPNAGPWNVGDPSKLAEQYVGDLSSGPGDVECNMFDTDKYQPVQGDRLRYNMASDRVLLDLDQPKFTSDAYVVKNDEVMQRWPNAYIGHHELRVMNSYSRNVKLEVEVRAADVPALMQGNEECNVWVPVDQLQFPTIDRYFQLGRSVITRRNCLWGYTADRALSLCYVMMVASASKGAWVPLVISLSCAIFCGFLVPSTITQGSAKWQGAMNEEASQQIAEKAAAVDLANQRGQIWPFVNDAVDERFDQMQDARDSRRCCGMYNCINKACFRPFKKMWNMEYWKTRGWITTREFFTGPAGLECFKALIMMGVSFSMLGWFSSGLATLWVLMFALIACWCLSYESSRKFYATCREFTEVWLFRWLTNKLFTLNIIMSLPDWIPACTECCKKRRIPTIHKTTVRRFRTPMVNVVVPELGIDMPGRTKETIWAREWEKTAVGINRGKIYAELHTVEPINQRRRRVGRYVPYAMPYCDFVEGGNSNRLVGTVQVVTHTKYAKKFRQKDDDMFFSFYTDPQMMNEAGDVRTPAMNSGCAVHYVPSSDQVIIQAPGIEEGKTYKVETTPGIEVVENDTPTPFALQGSSAQGVVKTVKATVTSPGVIVVETPAGQDPDIFLGVEVQGSGVNVVVTYPGPMRYDPGSQGASDQKLSGILTAYNRKLEVGEYQVKYTTVGKGEAFKQTVDCKSEGTLMLNVAKGKRPDITSSITITDEASGYELLVDPKQTDAYTCQMPEHQYHGIVKALYAAGEAICRVWYYIVGADYDDVEEHIPCTVIQCTDPTRMAYRVIPNFQIRGMEIMCGIEANHGTLTQMKSSHEGLREATHRVMNTGDILSFWRRNGVWLDDDTGVFKDPLVSPEAFGKTAVDIDKLVPKLEKVVTKKIQKRIDRLEAKLKENETWEKAYFDPRLFKLQAQKDDAEWTLEDPSIINSIVKSIQAHKKPYEQAVVNFQYPANASGGMLYKRGCVDGQIRRWQSQFLSWASTEMGLPSEEDAAGTGGGSAAVGEAARPVHDLMTVLRRALNKVENQEAGQFKPIVHYVAPCTLFVGSGHVWRPDPIQAHSGFVRVWEKASADKPPSDMTAVWLPCMIKLTCDRLKILFPRKVDARPDLEPWQQVPGYSVSLSCFERVEAANTIKDKTPTMRNAATKLTFRANMKKDRSEEVISCIDPTNDQEGEVVFYDPETNTRGDYLILVSKRVPSDQAKASSDVDFSSIDSAGKINACPLQLRCSSAYFNKWSKLIVAAEMDKPPPDGASSSPPSSQKPPPASPAKPHPVTPTVTPATPPASVATPDRHGAGTTGGTSSPQKANTTTSPAPGASSTSPPASATTPQTGTSPQPPKQQPASVSPATADVKPK
eukprot:GHVN01060422.1.p1 GENE.GHVN01060422.1~~GHVN01060422.1.p1  ORF type:complete len:2083 (+),score=314.92 GHVN01060422.1:1281-7529(+)